MHVILIAERTHLAGQNLPVQQSHTQTHTLTESYIHTRVHTQRHTLTLKRACMCSRSYTRTYTHALDECIINLLVNTALGAYWSSCCHKSLLGHTFISLVMKFLLGMWNFPLKQLLYTRNGVWLFGSWLRLSNLTSSIVTPLLR